jgi:hypothetical protein
MELRVPLPKTPDGKTNQRCTRPDCHPAIFRVGEAPGDRSEMAHGRARRNPGPGQTVCPYCGHMGSDHDFISPDDIEAVKEQIVWAAKRDVADFLRNTTRL